MCQSVLIVQPSLQSVDRMSPDWEGEYGEAVTVRGRETMTEHDQPNAALARESFSAIARGDTQRLSDHLADDVVWHVREEPSGWRAPG